MGGTQYSCIDIHILSTWLDVMADFGKDFIQTYPTSWLVYMV
jgi:hypothetical protein